jgi:SAM-dependent methyltransferase
MTTGTPVVGAGFVELYEGAEFGRLVDDEFLPELLELTDLGDDPLYLVAGPASAAPALRAHAPRLTVAQFDPAFTAPVVAGFADDPGTCADEVEPTALPYAADRFSAATVILSLLHLDSAEAQDAALAELARVLRPGALLAGFNAIDGPHLRRLDAERRTVPMDPLTVPARLERAGFTDVREDVWHFPRFSGRAPRSG